MKTKTLLRTAILAGFAWSLSAETPPPIACNLKALTSEQRKSLDRVGEHVISAITATRELTDGYAFLVDPSKASVTDVAFYEFQVDLHGADATLWLSVKGRPGVKEYIPIDSPRLAAKLKGR